MAFKCRTIPTTLQGSTDLYIPVKLPNTNSSYISSGLVYLAKNSSNHLVAIKAVSIKSVIDKNNSFPEIDAMIELSNYPNCDKHIVCFHEFIQRDDCGYIVMEYIKGLSLDKHIREERLSENSILDIFRILIQTLHYMHKKNIMHRDIKPDNIILETISRNESNIKIVDLGFACLWERPIQSRYLLSGCSEYNNSASYVDPIIAKFKIYDNPKSDIYSLGLVIFSLIIGQVLNIQQVKEHFDLNAEILRELDKCEYKFADIVKRMLSLDIEERPTSEEVVLSLEAI